MLLNVLQCMGQPLSAHPRPKTSLLPRWRSPVLKHCHWGSRLTGTRDLTALSRNFLGVYYFKIKTKVFKGSSLLGISHRYFSGSPPATPRKMQSSPLTEDSTDPPQG